MLYLRGSGTFTYIPDDPALPALSTQIHPGLLVKFDNRAGRHSIVGAVVNGEPAARIFVGPLTLAGVLGRGGECDTCYEELHCGGGGCRCDHHCDCSGICLAYSKRQWRWLKCSHNNVFQGRGRGKGKGRGKGELIEENDSAGVDGCEYCGGDLSECIHAGTVPVTVNMSCDQTAWRQINLSRINGEVLTTIDLTLCPEACKFEVNPTVADWAVRDLLQLLSDEMKRRMGLEAARNIYLTRNGLCLSKIGRDLESLPLYQFMALEQGQCCDPEWHGWYCHVCGTQH